MFDSALFNQAIILLDGSIDPSNVPTFLKSTLYILCKAAPVLGFFSLCAAIYSLHLGEKGHFFKWIAWAVLLLTLWSTLPLVMPSLSGEFATAQKMGAEAGTWGGKIETGLNEMKKFVSDYVIPVVAAFFVLKGIVEFSEGHRVLLSFGIAIALLTISTIETTLTNFTAGTSWGHAMAAIWREIATVYCPIFGLMAIIGAIINYARRKPVVPLVASAFMLLSVSGVWAVIKAVVR
jgi:hypothetical protein